MHCDHCCERSNKNNKPNFLSLEKLEKYLHESKTMSIRPDKLISFSGGEVFAPYMHNNLSYIPTALNLAYRNGYVPTFKTNGTWGDNETLRTQIIHDIGKLAFGYDTLVTLDISVDEFHRNQSGVIKIIKHILSNPLYSYTIRFCLVGFNTPASAKALNSLQQELEKQGFNIHKTINNDWIINDLYVCNDFGAPVYNQGRAKQTKTYTTIADQDNDIMDCIQIDNNDYMVLNQKYREPIKNRPLQTVLESLKQKVQ